MLVTNHILSEGGEVTKGLLLATMDRFAFAIVGVGVVLVAFLVNRFAPLQRRHIRRLVVLYGFYLAALGLTTAVNLVGWHVWGERLSLCAALLEAFTIVNILSLLLFDLALPAMKIDLVSITSDILTGVAYIVTGMGVVHDAGMDLGSVVATSAVIGGVLTLSLQTTLGNILGGVALQLDGSIHVGDWIQFADGKQGYVREIHWRHTVVETRDWDTIIVPNSSLLASNIIILGKREGQPLQHRMTIMFNVDFRFAPSRVIQVVDEALQGVPIEGAALEPKPNTLCYDFARDGRDSYATYVVRYWLTDLAHDDGTNSRVRARMYKALKRAGIPLAIPARKLFLEQEEDEQTRTRRQRDKRLTAIQQVDLFHSLRDEELDFLVDRLKYTPFTAGEIVTRKGSVARCLYLLTSGSVEIRASAARAGGNGADDGPSAVVATIEAPGFFGEMALMTGEVRSADVVARSDIECYQLDKEGLEKVLHDRPEVAEAISQTLAKRRVELDAIREGLDAQSKRLREAHEQQRILSRIQAFFGLEGGT